RELIDARLALMALECPKRFARGSVPQANPRFPGCARSGLFAVRRERNVNRHAPVAWPRMKVLARGKVPDAYCRAPGAAQSFVFRGERERRCRVACEVVNLLPRFDSPQAHIIRPARGEPLAIRREFQARKLPLRRECQDR